MTRMSSCCLTKRRPLLIVRDSDWLSSHKPTIACMDLKKGGGFFLPLAKLAKIGLFWLIHRVSSCMHQMNVIEINRPQVHYLFCKLEEMWTFFEGERRMEDIRGFGLSPIQQEQPSPQGFDPSPRGFDESHTEDTEMYQPVTQIVSLALSDWNWSKNFGVYDNHMYLSENKLVQLYNLHYVTIFWWKLFM